MKFMLLTFLTTMSLLSFADSNTELKKDDIVRLVETSFDAQCSQEDKAQVSNSLTLSYKQITLITCKKNNTDTWTPYVQIRLSQTRRAVSLHEKRTLDLQIKECAYKRDSDLREIINKCETL